MSVLLQSEIPEKECQRGKVRDIYDLGNRLILVATDRISAFDFILPTGIPDKGKVLTALTLFWLEHLQVPNHLISTDVEEIGEPFLSHREQFEGRSMLVQKTKVVPIECVVRGYLIGSGWKDYQRTGQVCGLTLPSGLQQASRLPEPIFTPATKADSGHDENISFEEMSDRIGESLACELRDRSIEIYSRASEYALSKGIILADTKFEWGQLPEGEVILIDEVLTSDSSRYWPADEYRVGQSPPSFDKQFVRDWLESSGWDKNSPPPELPTEVVQRTRAKYLEAYRLLSGVEL